MTCGCKHKKGSGRATYLSGVTWGGYPKKGKGIVFRGGGLRKRRRKKKSGGMSMTGGGVNFSGGAINAAMRVVLNRFRNGRRVI